MMSGLGGSSETDPTFREIILNNFEEPFYLGATIAAKQLGTPSEGLLTRNYNYTVAENAGKQARVHPRPNEWNWADIDAVVSMAERNGLAVRLHGPISPQASHWAKADERTGEELVPMMEDYMTRQCIRFNGKAVVKWMDVVNETVTPKGEWFGPKPGVDKWENPWTIIGSDKDKLKTPLYISRAFEIANEYAPDVSLVFNQHGGMEKKMWDRVKTTILYLRAKGLRVDGLGWQAHLDERRNVGSNPEQLDRLRELIDWAHANELDFHVTEIDYKIRGEVNAASQALQAKNYANILAVLLEKRSSGVVTFNTWGLHDREGKHTNLSRYLFAEELAPKPAVFAMKKVLESGN
jgi:GH35 family endo-1,4-beta-xylanase